MGLSATALGIARVSSVVPRLRWRHARGGGLWLAVTFAVASLVVASGCTADAVPRTSAAQSPREYLNNALDWIDEHSLVKRTEAEAQAARTAALAHAPDPRTYADAYPAIRFALDGLHDASAFFLEPDELADYTGLGITAMYPSGTVVFVEPNSPAARSGIREGSTLLAIHDAALQPQGRGPSAASAGTWFVDTGRRPTYTLDLIGAPGHAPTRVEIARTAARYEGQPTARRFGRIGYLELPWDGGWGDYPLRTQRAIASLDSAATCGWILDLRRNIGGDFWAYMAGTGPLLGEGRVGAFRFPDGHREEWSHVNGRVLWDGEERGEGFSAGPAHVLERTSPPVALLTSRATFTAAELLRVAFEGRPRTRTFGESTGGRPVLLLHSALSDNALVSVAAANAADRNGRVFDGPIPPDESVAVDWALFGSNVDPVVMSALEWLRAEPDCSG